MSHEAEAVLDAIRSRRSVRRFTGEPVPDEVVRRMAEAAAVAPSGGGRRLCRMHAIRRRETLAAMREAAERKIAALRDRVKSPRAREQYDGYSDHFTGFDAAPIVIAVLAKPYDSIYTRIVERYVPPEERPRQLLVEVAG